MVIPGLHIKYRLPALLAAWFVVGCALAVSSAAASELWKKGELLAGEDFSGDLSNWLVEGDVQAAIEQGRLRFEALEKTEVKKGNIWWRIDFSGPLLIEYDYQSATPYGLSMFWFLARGKQGEDLLSFTRSGVYDEYVKGRMNGYHISYHRFDSGVSNLRKSYGFHMLSSHDDPIPINDLDLHHITIYCCQGHIRFLVDGKLVHDFIDRGQPCLEGETWHHDYPCKGTGAVLTEGKIGIRHTQKQVAYYDNFRVYRLVKP
jgi:hypothetical protein